MDEEDFDDRLPPYDDDKCPTYKAYKERTKKIRESIPSPSTQRFGRYTPDPEKPHITEWVWRPNAKDDIDELFKRCGEQAEFADDLNLYDACVLDRFVTQVIARKPVDNNILLSVAFTLRETLLQGEPWKYKFILPKQKVTTALRNRRQELYWRIFLHAYNIKNPPQISVTQAIEMAAEKFSVSFGTARRAYYLFDDYFI